MFGHREVLVDCVAKEFDFPITMDTSKKEKDTVAGTPGAWNLAAYVLPPIPLAGTLRNPQTARDILCVRIGRICGLECVVQTLDTECLDFFTNSVGCLSDGQVAFATGNSDN